MTTTRNNMINVGSWISKWALIQSSKVAVISNGNPFTYAQLNSRVNKLSNLLLDRGIKKGDRVGVLLRNCLEYIEIFFALSKIGGILVPLNWRLAIPELEFIMQDSGTDFIIFEDSFLENAEKLRKKIRISNCISCSIGGVSKNKDGISWATDYQSSVGVYPDTEPITPVFSGEDDPHILMYTSGTTGLPKGVVLSHRKTFFNVLNASQYFDLSRNDRLIVARPLFHSGGLIVEMAPVMYKGGTVIIKKRFSPVEILETIQRFNVTILELPATVYNFILNECDISQFDFSSIKCAFTGGERVSVSLLRLLKDKGLLVSQIYGLTEASTLFWLPIERAEEKMGSVGSPVMHGDIRIVDEKGRPVAAGTVGEVVVRGPIVMNGYWRRPDLTREVIKDGWLHTGDLAIMDEDGFVYIVDRKKDMFISGGENVYPAEIEHILLSHPKILDAAVVGIPSEKWGEVGKAFVVLREGQTMQSSEITGYLEGKLGRYKIPKIFEFVDKLPKTASGKIKKRLLKDIHQ
ncbi:MAG TPA: long-chain fatty acid--CoA ligase [Syntrophorhabdaceae bacterium]|nr:long-chain fatty acid--CoA ligase [Syntrophorhabdaceae bacterium]